MALGEMERGKGQGRFRRCPSPTAGQEIGQIPDSASDGTLPAPPSSAPGAVLRQDSSSVAKIGNLE